MSWVPERKIATAGTIGPILTTAGVAWLMPGLSAPAVAALASLATALVGYLTRGQRESANPSEPDSAS